jgi:hypothetical protein
MVEPSSLSNGMSYVHSSALTLFCPQMRIAETLGYTELLKNGMSRDDMTIQP